MNLWLKILAPTAYLRRQMDNLFPHVCQPGPSFEKHLVIALDHMKDSLTNSLWYSRRTRPQTTVPTFNHLYLAEFATFLNIYHNRKVYWSPYLIYLCLGRGCVLYADASIFGDRTFGDNMVASMAATVNNTPIPDSSVVFGSSPNLVIKPNRRNVVNDVFRDSAR
jgi:hypothetical protein